DMLLAGAEKKRRKYPEVARKDLREAVKLAKCIRDGRRCTLIARCLAVIDHRQFSSTIGMYPDGYVKWLNTLMQADSYEEFLGTVKLGLKKMLSIGRAVFIIQQNGVWHWSDGWGKRPETRNQRTITRFIENNRQDLISNATGWNLVSFPAVLSYRGFLAIHLDVNQTSESAYNDTLRIMNLLIRPVALIRDVLKNQDKAVPNAGFLQIKDAADNILGESADIQLLREKIRTIADSPSTVHIIGETGTGKELVARAIHFCGQRRNAPFVAFNCSTSTASLVDSELFGHLRGAFTGAGRDRKGVFLAAHRGTLFLDEVADLPLLTQAKLLRAIQEKTIRPLGSDMERSIDIRIVSATHKDLRKEIAEGRFREDLFYRLVVIKLPILPLRYRTIDIPLLAHWFLKEIAIRLEVPLPEISSSAICWLKTYSWPGNIRELQNLMEVAVNFSNPGTIICPEDLMQWSGLSMDRETSTLVHVTEQCQRAHIGNVLASCGGNMTKSAEKLNISRQGLFKKIKSLGIIRNEEFGS
ncbi:sigma-54 dependent transcriptional regulator, partial [bacterium]|nr:sigma-54 dependent transcriptional regulator [bacterium]